MRVKFPMRFRTCLHLSALNLFAVTAALLAVPARSQAVEPPRLVQKQGRYALLVEGRPYLILGGQIHNSSAWPSELGQVWESMEALHANTIEAPVYWEQFERQPGSFDYTNASVSFHLPGKLPWMRSEIVTAEQGTYENGVWKPLRLWNGDETDRGLCFYQTPQVVRVQVERF